ncbi:MAG: hypothetical protein JEY97_13400 [Bacteroidales bacterium]|nr:hypothetical protein [Bacteroidales bacterium]
MRKKIEKEILDTMSKNPNNWKGIFYVNPKDSRIIVPKLNQSLGWTLNFGNKFAFIGLTAIILIIVASQIFF